MRHLSREHALCTLGLSAGAENADERVFDMMGWLLERWQTHQDFLRAIRVFVEAEYNIMDVDSKQFDDDFYTFRCQVSRSTQPTANTTATTREHPRS